MKLLKQQYQNLFVYAIESILKDFPGYAILTLEGNICKIKNANQRMIGQLSLLFDQVEILFSTGGVGKEDNLVLLLIQRRFDDLKSRGEKNMIAVRFLELCQYNSGHSDDIAAILSTQPRDIIYLMQQIICDIDGETTHGTAQ